MNTRTRTKEKYMSSRGDAHAGLCNHDDCLDQCCQTAQSGKCTTTNSECCVEIRANEI